MTTTLPLPAPTVSDTDDAEPAHLFCCDPNRAWCGADISGDVEVPDEDSADDCPLCLLAEESDRSCAHCQPRSIWTFWRRPR